jgi:hypothetical protein
LKGTLVFPESWYHLDMDINVIKICGSVLTTSQVNLFVSTRDVNPQGKEGRRKGNILNQAASVYCSLHDNCLVEEHQVESSPILFGNVKAMKVRYGQTVKFLTLNLGSS